MVKREIYYMRPHQLYIPDLTYSQARWIHSYTFGCSIVWLEYHGWILSMASYYWI